MKLNIEKGLRAVSDAAALTQRFYELASGIKNRLSKKVQHLKETNKLITPLIQKDGLYYTESGEGPFCPNCYSISEEISLLETIEASGTRISINKCFSCNWFEFRKI